MGNNVYQVGDQNREFYILLEYQTNDYYPSNPTFQQRISAGEWTSFHTKFIAPFNNYNAVLMPMIFCLSVVAIILSILFKYFFAVFFFIIFVSLGIGLFKQQQMNAQLTKYNKALFIPRGVFVRYYQGSKHSRARLHVTMAFPATAQAATLLIGAHDINTVNSIFCPELDQEFQAANEQFARSPAAQELAPLNVSPAGFGQANIIQVQVPPGAGPGSTIQIITSTGAPLNVVVPANTFSGQVFAVQVAPQPTPHPVAQAQVLPYAPTAQVSPYNPNPNPNPSGPAYPGGSGTYNPTLAPPVSAFPQAHTPDGNEYL